MWVFYFSHKEKNLTVYSKLKKKKKRKTNITYPQPVLPYLQICNLFTPVSTTLAFHLASILRVTSV